MTRSTFAITVVVFGALGGVLNWAAGVMIDTYKHGRESTPCASYASRSRADVPARCFVDFVGGDR